jgi:hypothetical protein
LGGILKKSYKVVVAIAAASLLTSVAVAPANAAGTKQKVCVALDTAGINDKSFNQTSYEGAKAAKAAGYASTIEYLPAKSGADYAPNIQKFVDKKCTLIIGIGYLLGDAVGAAAAAKAQSVKSPPATRPEPTAAAEPDPAEITETSASNVTMPQDGAEDDVPTEAPDQTVASLKIVPEQKIK